MLNSFFEQFEVHYSRIYRTSRRFETHRFFEDLFKKAVALLHKKGHLDISLIHEDGTTTAVKTGGDNLGFNGYKHKARGKVVAFCERNCNVIFPFVSAPGNRNEPPLFKAALSQVMSTARILGIDLAQTIISLDGMYDSHENRKAIFNRGMVLNIHKNLREKKIPKRGRKYLFDSSIFQERFNAIERAFA